MEWMMQEHNCWTLVQNTSISLMQQYEPIAFPPWIASYGQE